MFGPESLFLQFAVQEYKD